jgi:hypothetical protein
VCDSVTVSYGGPSREHYIMMFAPSSCQYVRQKSWYSTAQVLRYSSACDSNPYGQPPFNCISKVEFLNISVVVALTVVATVCSDIHRNRKCIRSGGKRILLLAALISEVYWLYLQSTCYWTAAVCEHCDIKCKTYGR